MDSVCLINFHYQNHPIYKLIVVANRDEEYNRPTKEAHFWEDEPMILAGRDLHQMGTWLGVTKTGKFAALTNYRDPSLPVAPKSRGEIVTDFLTKDLNPEEFIQLLKENRADYGGYNVLIGNGDVLYHYNNVLDESNPILPGTYSLSNASLNTPWPKVTKGKNTLQQIVTDKNGLFKIEELFEMMTNHAFASDEELPNTGVGIELERLLSPMFIQIPQYGTRCSTVVLISHQNQITFVERTFDEGNLKFERKFEFTAK